MAKKSTSMSAAKKAGGAGKSAAKVEERSAEASAKRRVAKSEPSPMKWKVMAFLDGLALTLLKSQDKAVAEGEVSRLVAEGRYQEVTVYPIDEDVPPPNPAKQEQEHARAHRNAELASKAGSKAVKPSAAKTAKSGKAAKKTKPTDKKAEAKVKAKATRKPPRAKGKAAPRSKVGAKPKRAAKAAKKRTAKAKSTKRTASTKKAKRPSPKRKK
jgi:hypothetical protein